jgi:glycerophosphoryl diester phosphodiesterase
MRASRFSHAFLFLVFCLPATFASGQLIIAHRGASHDAPGNTLAAFRLAWQQGADGVEGDYYLTADGRVVCIHDVDTQRVAGEKLIVAETSFEQLRKLDVGAWKGLRWRGEKIPSMEEVLATVPSGKKAILELKVGPEIVEPMAKILAASGLQPEQIVIISFHPETIAACEQRLPQLRTHWLTGYEKQEDGTWKPTARQVTATLQRIRADGLGSKAVPEYLNGTFLEQLRLDGLKEYHVWTVDDPEVAREYQRLGAWGITTNRPGWLRRQLELQPEMQPELQIR